MLHQGFETVLDQRYPRSNKTIEGEMTIWTHLDANLSKNWKTKNNHRSYGRHAKLEHI